MKKVYFSRVMSYVMRVKRHAHEESQRLKDSSCTLCDVAIALAGIESFEDLLQSLLLDAAKAGDVDVAALRDEAMSRMRAAYDEAVAILQSVESNPEVFWELDLFSTDSLSAWRSQRYVRRRKQRKMHAPTKQKSFKRFPLFDFCGGAPIPNKYCFC